MRGLQSLDVDSLSLAAKIGTISSMISQTYASHWSARPLSALCAPIAVGGWSADGFTVARAQLLPLSLLNRPPGTGRDPKYYVYTANQVQIIKIEGHKPLYLQPDEIIVLSSSLPLEIVVSRSYTTTALIFESDLFRRYFPNPEEILARRLSYPCGLEAALNAMIESAWSISHTGRLDQTAPKLMRGFLELLSTVDTSAQPEHRVDTRTALDIRRDQVKAYVERHYAQPEISVASIARELNVSPRYLQLAFAADDTSPSAFLRKCRLDACARLLRDPRWARKSITETGFACGFNSSAHLSTEFKRAFGVSPREYRRAAVDGSD
jgi:AraC-like DNA-binding protein